MTKEELDAMPRRYLRDVMPFWDSLNVPTMVAIETAFNLEWWRGYHAKGSSKIATDESG